MILFLILHPELMIVWREKKDQEFNVLRQMVNAKLSMLENIWRNFNC